MSNTIDKKGENRGSSEIHVLRARLIVTPAAMKKIHPKYALECLKRHFCGDWGDVCELDKRRNELAMLDGNRLLSAYRDESGTKFWIITEADRSRTTIRLADE